MLIYALVLEAFIGAGSGLDAWIRNDERQSWGRRWVWWHLGPVWALCLGIAAGLEVASRRLAAGAVRRYDLGEPRPLTEMHPD